jgi:hypothetical protein
MTRVIATVGVCLMLAFPAGTPLRAQQKEPPKEEPPAVDVSKLPVNPERVQRKLRETLEREEFAGNTLKYNIDVFAFAPRIQLFAPDENFVFGPGKYQAPTNSEMINMMTPQEFRSPVMDFNNLARWLQGDKSKSEKK